VTAGGDNAAALHVLVEERLAGGGGAGGLSDAYGADSPDVRGDVLISDEVNADEILEEVVVSVKKKSKFTNKKCSRIDHIFLSKK
jgi:hypothetical protein